MESNHFLQNLDHYTTRLGADPETSFERLHRATANKLHMDEDDIDKALPGVCLLVILALGILGWRHFREETARQKVDMILKGLFVLAIASFPFAVYHKVVDQAKHTASLMGIDPLPHQPVFEGNAHSFVKHPSPLDRMSSLDESSYHSPEKGSNMVVIGWIGMLLASIPGMYVTWPY